MLVYDVHIFYYFSIYWSDTSLGRFWLVCSNAQSTLHLRWSPMIKNINIFWADLTLKETNIWAIILVPLIMTLSRGHTGQIKRTVIMRWLWLPYRGNKVAQWRDLVFYDKILIFILVIEIVIYTGKSPLEAPIILWATETVPYQLIL